MSSRLAPGSDCDLCPRLMAFRLEQRALHGDWHNAPVPSFGTRDASLLIVGLAPGLRGANKTGRPFTGDFAGNLLYATLGAFGFAAGVYGSDPSDSLELINCRITNAVRCVPPQNKPIGAEMTACRPFLRDEIRSMPNLKLVLALGRIAHENILRTFELKLSAHKFVHGACHDLGDGVSLFDSYHCSRYNTNTGRLTEDMFRNVFADIKCRLDHFEEN